MAVSIHPTAMVDPAATLDHDVVIGPYCVVGAGAFVGRGTRLVSHVTLDGHVRLGEDNVLYPHAVIGAPPQDDSYRGSPTWVVIGDGNTFREHVTIHRATEKENGVTRVGSHNYLMVGSHVAHDCVLGSHIHIANGTVMGGHVHIHDHANISGLVAIHHYATIGTMCFIGGLSRITMDVPPFMLVEGNPSVVRCVNVVGLKRRGLSQLDIQSLAEAHRLLYRTKMGAGPARDILQSNGRMTEPVRALFTFIESQHQGRLGRSREKIRKAA